MRRAKPDALKEVGALALAMRRGRSRQRRFMASGIRAFSSAAVVALAFVFAHACKKKKPEGTAPVASASTKAKRQLSEEDAKAVLAKVGERTITLGDYVASLERMGSVERLRYQSLDRRKLLLNEMIELELLAEEAQRRGLDKLPETQARLRQMLRDELFEALRREVPGPNEIPEVQVRKYYEAHKAEFDEPERRRVAHIALGSERQAKQVLAQFQEGLAAEAQKNTGVAGGATASPGASLWGKLVSSYSLDKPPAAIGPLPDDLAGDLGIVGPPGHPRGANPRVPEALRAAVFRIAETGQVLPEVVPEGGRFHIVRMTGKTPARSRRYEEAERTIRVALVQENIKAREAELERELREKYPVTIDPKALSSVRVEGPKDKPPGQATEPH